jgi:DNA-binding SARP family transcriptional activator/Tfp pilus assembly protein PilF
MRFGILGPLLVHDGEAALSVPAGRQRVLLAALLVRAGQAVRPVTLADIVWDGSPPPGAIDTLRTHVMRLRRTLGPGAGTRLITRYPGYLIDAGEDEVDLLRFSRLCRDGGAAARAGSWLEAAQILTEALALWRGPVLADVASQLLQHDQVPRLDQLRFQAQERRIDADLHLGRHADLIPELHALAAEHPLRERFHAQLMLALYRCGLPAEALAAYRSARAALIEELGTEPGSELRELHQQILTADPALAMPEPDGSAAGDSSLIPRQLPRPVPQFVGRDQELAALTQSLEQAAHAASAAVVISAIGGTAGVGKTALAVHWAHHVADRFPDGQLHVNLRGYDPDQPVTAAEALAGFLRALGVKGQDIPAEKDERAACYRSLLAGRRMLVVLDNAGSAEQVRPLLPGTRSCMAIVTSRDALAGLVARDGGTRLDLDLLPSADAVLLLRALIGERADADPDATAKLAALCCRLPLALRVAAELAVAQPAVALVDLVEELTDQQRRLDLLDADGDPCTAVRAVFSWSYRNLDPDVAHVFRLAGLHPGPDLEPYAASAFAATTVQHAREVLGVLARSNLIYRTGPGRYGMHDLLRAYARELAAVHDGENGQRTSLTRLFDHYLQTAAMAMDILYPGERLSRPRIDPSAAPTPLLTDAAAAQSWLDDERATFVAVTVHAAERGWPDHATRLAAILFRYLNLGCHHPEATTIYTHAATAAGLSGDRAAEAAALTSLGTIDRTEARYEQAGDRHRQAQEMFREAGDRDGQARALGNLGLAYTDQGRFQEAARAYRQALNIFRQTGGLSGEVRTLCNLGIVEERLGRYQQAARRQKQSLTIAREIGARDTEYLAMLNLGIVRLRQGRYTKATDDLRRALALFRENGYRAYESVALARIGDACLQQGSPQDGTSYLQEALALSREIGDRSGEADALNSLGDVLIAARQPDDARTRYTAALGLAEPIGDKYQQARAHSGLGHAYHAAGERDQARSYWQRALSLFSELGCPEADQVRAHLTGLCPSPTSHVRTWPSKRFGSSFIPDDTTSAEQRTPASGSATTTVPLSRSPMMSDDPRRQ